MFDSDHLAVILREAARLGTPLSYSEILNRLGYAFSRPKMRALCLVLGDIDTAGAARGEPELACFVVRASDHLPGEGWWIGRNDYKGETTGPKAAAYVKRVQKRATQYWR